MLRDEVLKCIPERGALAREIAVELWGSSDKRRVDRVSSVLANLAEQGLVERDVPKYGKRAAVWRKASKPAKAKPGKGEPYFPKILAAVGTGEMQTGEIIRAVAGELPSYAEYSTLLNAVQSLARRGELVEARRSNGFRIWRRPVEELPPEPPPPEPEVKLSSGWLTGYVHGSEYDIGATVRTPHGIAKIASINVYASTMLYGVSGGSRLFEASDLEPYEPLYKVGQEVSINTSGLLAKVSQVSDDQMVTITLTVHETLLESAE